MPKVTVTRNSFLQDRQGRTFADVLNVPERLFEEVLDFFNDEARQRRMEESEIHHDRPPLAGVVRELESQPRIDDFLSSQHPYRTKRLRQAVGVVVRIIMERLGWKKVGKKGSLGVRGKVSSETGSERACHNTGGLALWFLRAERYERPGGVKFPTVRSRAKQLAASLPPQSADSGRETAPRRSKRSRGADQQ